jgi:hypothetical protein
LPLIVVVAAAISGPGCWRHSTDTSRISPTRR